MTKYIWLAALLTVALSATVQAAEKIRYDEIQQRIAPFGTTLEYRAFKVTTLDGKEHRGRTLHLATDRVRLQAGDAMEELPREQVSRIEIRQTGRFRHNMLGGVAVALVIPFLACAENAHPVPCMIPMSVLFSPLLAVPAVTTPVFLAADGVAFLIPAKVYEIVR